ncbi:MAG: CehA/McbA family metallohydrolase, partial [Xanthomonadales bacterium]|nr:CehA/McbA family metallohydrolase [Xanthomonadales bacterium]
MTQSHVKLLVILFWCAAIAWWVVARPGPLQTEPLAAGTLPDGTATFWFKGNTHAHAKIEINSWSHGNAAPAEVVQWYHDHGYHFAAITDHNRWHGGGVEDVAGDDFLMLSGMEITSDHRYPGVTQDGQRRIHSTALGTKQPLNWTFEDPSVPYIIRQHVTDAENAGGLAVLNHPNYAFQVQFQNIIDAPELGLLEIVNAHPRANQEGHAGFRPSVETLWDELLSSGRQVWGVAADDAHDFGWSGRLMRRFGAAPPGGAWIMVRAPKLQREDILDALESGDFYASTGVILGDVDWRENELRVAVNPALTEAETSLSWVEAAATEVPSDDSHVVIEFIGVHGKRLHWTHDQYQASYSLPADQPYMRARVTYLKKKFSFFGADRARAFYAWTQPVFAVNEST